MAIVNKNKKKKHKYDYKLKKVNDRASYIEEKLAFIFNLPPHSLMGYSSKSRNDESKYNKIPKMIDNYTSYLLESNDCGSSRKMEYSYYISERDEMRRKTNQALYRNSESFDDIDKEGLGHNETYIDEEKSYLMGKDYGFENVDTQVLKYAISKKMIDKKDYKKILSMSARILMESRDEELKEMIEQIIFNCFINCKDEIDVGILKEYIKEPALRDVSEKLGCSKDTVDRRINKLLDWASKM